MSQYLTLTDKALKRCRAIPHKPNRTSLECTALRALNKNKNIVITKADKGDTVVMMDLEQYTELAYKHLNDAHTYDKLTGDPTQRIAKGFLKYITHLRDVGILDSVALGFPFPQKRSEHNTRTFYPSYIRHH